MPRCRLPQRSIRFSLLPQKKQCYEKAFLNDKLPVYATTLEMTEHNVEPNPSPEWRRKFTL